MDKAPAQTDGEVEFEHKLVGLEEHRIELNRRQAKLDTEEDNRELRTSIAAWALVVMVVQIAAANGVFVWYGDTNGWDIPGAAIGAWLGATVVQVVAVVLVIMNYLFPKGGPKN